MTDIEVFLNAELQGAAPDIEDSCPEEDWRDAMMDYLRDRLWDQLKERDDEAVLKTVNKYYPERVW